MSRLKELRNYIDKEIMNIDRKDKIPGAFAHLYGVSLAANMIGEKRGLDSELLAMAAMLHDLQAYKSGSYKDHAHIGAELARSILHDLQLTTEEETDLICDAIYHHDDKLIKDGVYAEALKDADVIHHCMNDLSKPVQDKEKERYKALRKEFGIS